MSTDYPSLQCPSHVDTVVQDGGCSLTVHKSTITAAYFLHLNIPFKYGVSVNKQ